MMFAGAFLNGSKYEIKERSQGKSELSGVEDEPLVCGHLNHDRDHPHYNEPENGLRITKIEEYVYHARNRFEPQRIGLSEEDNDNVIRSYEKMLPIYYKNCSLEKIKDKICLAHDAWWDYESKKYWEKHRMKYIRNDSYLPPAF